MNNIEQNNGNGNFEQETRTIRFQVTTSQAKEVLNNLDPDAPYPPIEDINQICLIISDDRKTK